MYRQDYTPVFVGRLLLQWERGFRSRFMARCQYTKPRCHMQGALFMSVSLVGARTAYYLLLAGMALSLFVGLLEVAHSRWKKRAAACIPCCSIKT